jgi:DNA-binding FadR family transcriptional regulator
MALMRLRAYLAARDYGPQDRLEPERILASTLGCSRETLRAALAVLEGEGLVWRHVGQGTFVGPRPTEVPVRSAVLFEMASVADLLGARLVVEPAIAGAAAVAAGTGQVAGLRRLAAESGAAETFPAYERADAAFHEAIARASGNPLLVAVLDLLSAARGRARWQREHAATSRRVREREYAAQGGRMHATIVDAIASGDAERAHQAMHDHLHTIRTLMRQEPSG